MLRCGVLGTPTTLSFGRTLLKLKQSLRFVGVGSYHLNNVIKISGKIMLQHVIDS